MKKSYITSSTCVYAIEIILKFDTEEIDNGNIFINLTELPKIDLNSIRSVTEKLRLNSLAKSKNESTVSEIPKHNEKTSTPTPTPTPHSDVDNARQAFFNSQLLKTLPYILILTDDKLETVMVSDVFYKYDDVYDREVAR